MVDNESADSTRNRSRLANVRIPARREDAGRIMRIRIEKRTVYIGGNRAALSRAAAYRREARARIRAKYPCECEGPEHDIGYPGYRCEFHGEWLHVRTERLARFMRFLDKCERENRRGAS